MSKFNTERLDQFKASFPKCRDVFLVEFYKVDEILREKYPDLTTDERLEKTIDICGLILSIE